MAFASYLCGRCNKIHDGKDMQEKHQDMWMCGETRCLSCFENEVVFAPLGGKFVKKYMRAAKQIADDNDACYSRHLGVVLVKVYEDGSSKQVGGGYNGPPRKTPHCDSEEYLREVVVPQLTRDEVIAGLQSLGKYEYLAQGHPLYETEKARQYLARNATGCKTCPRRLIGAGTGERTELCSCQHAERNAIYNAGCDLHGCWAFCWCGVPCLDCAGAFINVGIKRVFVLDDGSYAHGKGTDYSFGSRFLFEKAKVELFLAKPEFYLG